MTVLLVSVAIGVLIIAAVWRYERQREAWQKQLSRYAYQTQKQDEKDVQFWEHWAWFQNLQTFASPAQIRKWATFSAAALVVAPGVLIANSMTPLVAISLSTTSIVLLLVFGYAQLQQKAMDAFRDQLPDIIDGLIRALRVGAPMVDVLDEMAMQQSGVASRVFKRMHDELKVGQTLSDVMSQASSRMPIAEFRFLTIVLSLQQETGGRLTGVLERLGHTLRARAELAASIQTITSESRNSAKVLAALPVLVCLVLFSTGREHFDFLMTSSGGQLVMAYVIASVLLGLVIIRRMTQLRG